MAEEEPEAPETEAADAAIAGADSAAMALALGRPETLDARAAAYLEKQGHLADGQRHLVGLQSELLANKEKFEISHLRWRRFSDQMKGTLQMLGVLVGCGVVALLANLVWSAAHDDGLVIEAFSVPPDLAARGLTGQTIATRMLDEISTFQAKTNTIRGPSTFTNNWDNDVKIEIPETGISAGEFNHYLHRLLGRQTIITGELVRNGATLTVTARAGDHTGERFSGPDSDVDALVHKAAEDLYKRTQPYRYGVYLVAQGRLEEAKTVFVENVNAGPATERAWDYTGLAFVQENKGEFPEGEKSARLAIALNPDLAFGHYRLYEMANNLAQAEVALAAGQKMLALLNGAAADELQPARIAALKIEISSDISDLRGDYAGEAALLNNKDAAYLYFDPNLDYAANIQASLAAPGGNFGTAIIAATYPAIVLLANHDVQGAGRILAGEPAFVAAIKDAVTARADARGSTVGDGATQAFRLVEWHIARTRADWPRLLRLAPIIDMEDAKLGAAHLNNFYPPTQLWPIWAYAEANSGDFAAAHARIDRTPGDCDLCLRTRAQIDALEKNPGGADYWFAEAIEQAPSIPFAYADWGQMLMQRGDFTGAIAKFKLANQKGPHFADPLEMWGEVLIAQNRSDLAITKFSEAEKYAPNWGRLHLKWGEALTYLGKPAEAQKQFARASELDLTTAEKSELLKVSGHV